MRMHHYFSRHRLASWIARVTAFLFAVFQPVNLDAADPKPTNTSLDKVPSDAESYSSILRLGETIETIGNSRAWKLLWEEPAVQEVWKKVKKAYDEEADGWESIKKFLADPMNKELPGLVADAFSQEIFFYSGKGTGDLAAFFLEIDRTTRFSKPLELLRGELVQNDGLADARGLLRACQAA